MNPFALSGLFIGVPSFILGILTIIKGRKKLHFIWALFCFSVALWGFGGYKIATAGEPESAVTWWKIAYIGVILIPLFFTHFIYEFLELSKRRLLIIAYSLCFVYLIINLSSNLFIDKVRLVFNQFYYISPPAPLYSPFVALFFGLVIYCHVKLLQAYKKSDGIKKAQIKYIFLSTIIGFTGGGFAFLPVYKIDLYPILNVTIALSPFIVAYAVFKYRLMDIRIVARRFFIYFGVTAFTYGMFYLVAWSYIKIFGDIFSSAGFFFGIIIAPIFATAFYGLNKFLFSIANRFFFFKLYNYQETINKLSQELNYYNDLGKIINSIVSTIKKTMQLNRAGVLLINTSIKPTHYEIAKVIGFNKQNGISLVTDNFLTQYLEKSQKPLIKDELDLLADDTKNKNEKDGLLKLKEHMTHIEASLCLPLMSNNKLIGIIVLGSKMTGDAYTKEDIGLLTTLAYQAGIAIDNAMLYKAVQDFNKTLKQRVYEQTKDIREKNIAIGEKNKYLEELLGMKTDFLRVVNHQLNTPLSVMRNAFAMVEDKTFPPEKGMEFATRGLERMSQTIADFWDAFQLEGQKMEMQPEKVDIESTIKRLAEEKKLTFIKGKEIKIIIQKPAFKMPMVWCDAKKILHVISNLLDNAVWYTPRGSVTVTYDIPNKDFLKVSIKDTGVGISEKTKEKLFQKFSRGQGASTLHPDGSGLGLYVAKKIVESNDGELTFFSEGEGKGSTFNFTLPIYTNQEVKSKTPKEALTIKQ